MEYSFILRFASQIPQARRSVTLLIDPDEQVRVVRLFSTTDCQVGSETGHSPTQSRQDLRPCARHLYYRTFLNAASYRSICNSY